jgi:hypothetical protein
MSSLGIDAQTNRWKKRSSSCDAPAALNLTWRVWRQTRLKHSDHLNVA